jgi:ubiquinol-cytochrome c reductase cytochrome c subunit
VHLVGHVHPGAGVLNLDLLPVVVLVAAAGLARRGRDAALLLLAGGSMALAVVGQVHDAAARSVTGHMTQHLVLVLVTAPLLGIVVATAPSRLRGARPLRPLASAIAHPLAPLAAGGLHVAMLILWHVPGPYDAAVRSWPVHGLEHLTLVASGAWWWSTIVHHAPRRGVATATVSLFGVATLGAAMGVFLMFATTPLYTQGGLGDQQMAGALMAGTGLVYGATGLWTGARAVARLSSPRSPRVPIGARGAATGAVVLGCLGVTVLALLIRPAGAQGSDAGVEPDDATPILSDQARSGVDLYRRDCASCHGPDGSGSFRGTPLTEVGTASVTYYLETGRMPIPRPDAAIRRSDPVYSPEQIDAIVAYVSTFVDGPDALDPDLDGASLSRGGELYRLHCAACHGAEAIGGALAFQGFAPSLHPSSPADVANAMLAGPGAMPAFSATFEPDDLADVASYVLMLQDPPRTGLALPGGRVAEGLVAWVAGLGSILLVVRWMGTRQ